MPDQFSLGSEGWVDDHHELLAVDQKVLKSGVGLFSVEGVRIEEVVPNEAFGRVECLAKGVLNDYFRYQDITCNRTSRSRRRDLDVFGRSSKIEGQPIHKTSVNFSLDTVSTKKSVVADEKKCWASFLSVACNEAVIIFKISRI